MVSAIPVFVGITIITFSIVHLAPGEPAGIGMDLNANQSNIAEQLRKEYGLDKPLHEQYLSWVGRMLQLDFGMSMSMDRRPVAEKIAEALPVTLLINSIEIMLVFLCAIPLGVLSALRENGWADKLITNSTFFLFSAPSFWTALLLMMLFSVQLGWLPLSGLPQNWYDDDVSMIVKIWSALPYLALPILTMLFGSIAGMTRYIRMTVLEVKNEDYVRTARAKGLSNTRVIRDHILRNGLLPIVTLVGLMLPGMIGGSIILEQVFALPGMGRLFFGAVMMRDYSVVLAVLSVAAVLTLAGNMLADILYALLNPKIREQFAASNDASDI